MVDKSVDSKAQEAKKSEAAEEEDHTPVDRVHDGEEREYLKRRSLNPV